VSKPTNHTEEKQKKVVTGLILQWKHLYFISFCLTPLIYMELLVKPEILTSYVRIWTYVWQRWKPSLYVFCTMF
jgi:hypothetical protein